MKKLTFILIGLLMTNLSADELSISELEKLADNGSCYEAVTEINSSKLINNSSLYLELLESAFTNCEKEQEVLPKDVQLMKKRLLRTCQSKGCNPQDFAGGGSIYTECALEVAYCKSSIQRAMSIINNSIK